jgi:hypothetical protein
MCFIKYFKKLNLEIISITVYTHMKNSMRILDITDINEKLVKFMNFIK